MTKDDLNQKAELAVWPRSTRAAVAAGRAFATLREALSAACEAMTAGKDAWIVTEGGDILSPAWIRANGQALAS
ncbi:hypothetical protein MetexDRAFT_0377 [Methylorubrum extorquens DSM 13060]|uniref:Uncharacterized protein n=1 Tax=Methylorubrum extorquens DSM 13060 TaxID=882800 RepID=H1KCL5_METEX|nr:hypothetical protein [Methylorubrum extorquens]EHP94688.1 hypothetical protein MetexDRAFT_0377 [Methylorubrum extorquens DSM 13060]